MIPGIFPQGIKKIIMGNKFNRVIPQGVIPETVEMLYLGSEFNHRDKVRDVVGKNVDVKYPVCIDC